MNEIIELNNIFKNVTTDSLVIFDVDEVLIYPENLVQLQIASPFWEDSMADLEKRLGKATRDLLHSIMLLQTKWKLTDPRIPKLIRDLQLKKIRVIALTAFRRGKMGKIQSIEDWRNKQLKKYNIDFSITADLPKSYFEITKLNKVDGRENPIYKNGIIYTNQHPKGEVLSAFLEQMDLKPNKIIFIDDRLSNIYDIENFCKTANIKFIGIHHNGIMRKYNTFNKNLGKYQFCHLEHYHVWLTDLEAEKMIDVQRKKMGIINQ